jgi:pilus assembly protein CpaF
MILPMSAAFESTTHLPTVRVPSPADMRKKAHARIAERIDPVRTRHKPLSLLRQEAKRLLDQLFDQEAAHVSRPDRNRIVEDVLAEAPAIGVLEDLFRDEAIKEIIILTHNQIIGKKNDSWLPTSVRFRDAEQLRSVLAYYIQHADQLVPTGTGASGYDLKLPNGFRLLAIVPPAVMDLPPQVLLIRNGTTSPVVVSAPATNAIPSSSVAPIPLPRPNGSGTVSASMNPRNGNGGSGAIQFAHPRATEQSSGRLGPINTTPTPVVDPYIRFRQKVSERIVIKFASAGVYDLNQVPLPDLRRIVLAHVMEYCEQDKMGYDEATQERLALEILANMNR